MSSVRINVENKISSLRAVSPMHTPLNIR